MRDDLQTSTALGNGIVAVPGDGDETDQHQAGELTGRQNKLPPNEPGGDYVDGLTGQTAPPKPDATGPPEPSKFDGADYWNALINEKAAAQHLGMTIRWMQAKRQHGGGPKFIRISKRCVRYRRIDLKAYADRHLRSSTSDQGEAA